MPSSFPSRGRVLAVDDSSVIREILIASLEAAGYSVEAVATGQAALVAASRETFDAVILDVDMPGMDGLTLGRVLRGNPKTCSSPIAMHTSMDESVVRSIFDGYDAFLPKPCGARMLGECIDRLLREPRPR
jgi:DNA-binding response OmpR family regulator